MANNLFFVAHTITNRQGWDDFHSKWMDIFGSEGMNVDKVLAHPEFEGNQCLFSCPAGGDAHFCMWKMTAGNSKQDFQAFIDRFIGGHAINKGYSVAETLGAQALEGRATAREWVLAAKGGAGVGYLDKPQLWLTVHNITDRKAWEENVMEESAAGVRKCNSPSDCGNLGQEGHGTALVLMLDEDKCICVDGTPAGLSHGEYQKMIDEFTRGTAKNDLYLLNTKQGVGMMNLSEDLLNQEFMKWGEAYVNPFTKTASHEATNPAHAMDITASQ